MNAGACAMFDPYHKWLGIPPGQRPPTHYQLLGIAANEQDIEVIQEAAVRQSSHVRAHLTGPHTQDCKRILGEIAEARVVLTDRQSRLAYDVKLRSRRAPSASEEDSEDNPFGSAPLSSPGLSRRSPGRGVPVVIYLAVILAPTIAVAGVAYWMLGGLAKERKTQTDELAGLPAESGKPVPASASARAIKPASKGAGEGTAPKVPDAIKPRLPPIVKGDQPSELPMPRTGDVGPSEKAQPMPEVPPAKRPAPDAAAQAKAEQTIHELFKADYAKRKPEEKQALAARLFKQADATKDDPDARFVLLREARDLAAQAGDFAGSWRAIDALDQAFAIAVLPMRVAALEALHRAAATPAFSRAYAETALDLAEQALEADDYETASRLFTVADGESHRSGVSPLVARVLRRRDEADVMRKEFDSFKAALETLRSKPGDADACLVAGRFYCFRKNNWDDGLPLLAQCGDDELKALAQKDRSFSSDPVELIAVADGWSNWAAKDTGTARVYILLRAKHWYEEALPNLAGVNKSKAEKRLEEIETQLPAGFTVDVLKLIQPQRDAVGGQWGFENGVLVCPAGRASRLQLPYEPPREYTLRLVAQRTQGNDALVVGLLAGERQCLAAFDGWPNSGHLSGIEWIDGMSVDRYKGSAKGTVFPPGRPVEVAIYVRKNSIRVSAAGKALGTYTGAFARLSLAAEWAVPNKRSLLVGAWESAFRITRIEVTPLIGQGKVLE